MAIYKKSTPRPSLSEAKPIARPKGATSQKSETKVVPDEQDGTLPFVSETSAEAREFFESETEGGQPGQLSVDVFQTADEIVIVAPVAGVHPEEIAITITDEVLEIKGRRSFQFNVQPGDYFTQECFWGPFSRSVILPDAVDVSRVTASFKNGILTVRVPKVEKIRTRMVRIVEGN